jgi:hypothetical protein
MPSRWNYVDVNCTHCKIDGQIRIDQYNRKGKQWTCRKCVRLGKKINIKNPSGRHDPVKLGAWKSYWRAKKRVRENHKGVYKNVLFLFKNFSEFWDELGPRPNGYTLERINVKGNYELGNVKWANMTEQCRNKSNNLYVCYEGRKMCLYDAVKLSGIDPATIKKRIETGCPEGFIFSKGRWHVKTKQFFPSAS